MKTILFVNTRQKACAIHQYGVNLFLNLSASRKVKIWYLEPEDEGSMSRSANHYNADVILYNWHPSIGGWIEGAPYNVFRPVKNICVFHEIEWPSLSKFDAVLFSRVDEVYLERPKWHRIPLTLPLWKPIPRVWETCDDYPVIGVHGYGGAHAKNVVAAVCREFDRAIINLHLAPAYYGDPNGTYARIMGDECLKMADQHYGILACVRHDWMEQPQLLKWLSGNDMNVYLRDPAAPWAGVSAAMCAALAVKRPIAINRCESFRHLWECEPSVCIEDRSLKGILSSGIAPLEPIYAENTMEKLVARVEQILEGIL